MTHEELVKKIAQDIVPAAKVIDRAWEGALLDALVYGTGALRVRSEGGPEYVPLSELNSAMPRE